MIINNRSNINYIHQVINIAMNTAKNNTFRCQNNNKSIKASILPQVYRENKYESNKTRQLQPVKIDKYIKEGIDITFGESRLQVLFTPGHAPGHVVFYAPDEGIVIGGDVIFRQSIGRTDLLGGDFDTLIENI